MKAVRRPAALLAAMTLAVGALSACGGDDPDGDGSSTTTATPLDPSSSSSSSSGSESSSSSSSSGSGSSTSTSAKGDAPELPAAAKEHTDEGATAFAKFYWSEGGEALKSGDTTTIRALASDECDVCATYAKAIERDARKGLHANVNPSRIGTASITDETENKSDRVVTLAVKDSEYELVDESGESTGVADPVSYDIQIYVDWEGSGWVVVDTFMITG
ncbi:DUF6318 family protein [Janibacter sp. CX7]|uniref:DUF6318 family protein n=1 Tax=Janibacter sp. CX7 TaxID=2963431 RepID=UPI0020CF1D4B|nr:DUF6318 family protein [Janibacter sp. CX7]UTT67258.1 DUF6318 family protein [Janibacter sp. CX7]